MKQDITELWQQYTEWLKQNLPTEYANLQGPATEQDFAAFSKAVGFELPDNLKKLYAINNGAIGKSEIVSGNLNFALGLQFLTLEEVIEQWKSTPVESKATNYLIYPRNTIKNVDSNPKWIPMLYDSSGNYIGVDLDPDNKGTVGQVINFGIREYDKFVIAPSFEEFLSLLLKFISEGNVVITTEDDGFKHWDIKNSGHLIDGLRNILVPKRAFDRKAQKGIINKIRNALNI